jgi:hypothetical protein
MKNLLGFKNDFLEVISYYGERYSGIHYWNCKCKCDNVITRSTYEILSLKIKSCRKCCIKKNYKHGYLSNKIIIKPHGLSNRHPLYQAWNNIKQRCYNKKCPGYKNYGAKNIILFDGWINDFKSFYDWCIENGWEKGLAIDRIDPFKSYTPYNCQFLTKSNNSKKAIQDRKKKNINLY